MIQLNLLPDIKKEVVRAQRMRTKVTLASVGVSLLAIGILVLSVMWVYVGQPIRIKLAQDDIKKNTQALKQHKDTRKYLTIQNQLGSLPALHDEKSKSSRLLSFLPALNPNEPHKVKLTSVGLSLEESSLTLSGRATSFEALNVFTDTLKLANLSYVDFDDLQKTITEPMFTSVSLQNSGLMRETSQQIVTFTLNAQYSENAFSNKVSNVSLSVPLIENTKSVDQATMNLFEEATD